MIGHPDTPAVSVVVPLYNKERHVARAIESVLGQTFKDFEVIVVDDGSTDDSATLVAAVADPRIRVLAQPNAGASAARNRGIEAARAPLIAFLDADDAYRPDFLANILELRRLYPAAGAYAMNYETVGPRGQRGFGVERLTVERLLIDPEAFFRIGKFGSPVFSSSVAVPRTSFSRAGGFPVGVKLGEDLDTWIRICFFAPIAFDRRPGSIYFQDAEGRACATHPPPERYAFFDTIDRWLGERRDVPSALLDEVREFKNSFTIVYARFQVRYGVASEGRRALLHCRTEVFARQKWKWVGASFLPQPLQEALADFGAKLRSMRTT